MSSQPENAQRGQNALKKEIVANPELVLDDPQVMQALVAAFDRARGENIVDLRSVAMQQLEARLDRLEHNHRSVVTTAFENMSGMQQIHAATLELGRNNDRLESFVAALGDKVPQILRIKSAALLFETHLNGAALARLDHMAHLHFLPAGQLRDLTPESGGFPVQRVMMRPSQVITQSFHVQGTSAVGSEAFISLDLGPNRLPAVLLMGAQEPETFAPQKGSTLLEFLGDFVESQLIRLLRE